MVDRERRRRCRVCRARMDALRNCQPCEVAMAERVRQDVDRLLGTAGRPGIPTGHPASDSRRLR